MLIQLRHLALVAGVLLNFKETGSTVHWMHIQKTSSWLGNFLLLWSCSQLRNDYSKVDNQKNFQYSVVSKNISGLGCESSIYTGNSSYGYHTSFPEQLNQSCVTVFRNPYDRIISAFLFGEGKENIMLPRGFPKRDKMKYDVRQRIREAEVPIVAYAQTPGIPSCQTKMMLGKNCGEVIKISETKLQEAIRRVRYDMKFVGLTEETEASARLFLAMHPFPRPENSISPVDLTVDELEGAGNVTEMVVGVIHLHTRINHAHTPELNAKLRQELTTHHWVDVADQAVYREAVAVFYERCARYGIVTQYTKETLLAKT